MLQSPVQLHAQVLSTGCSAQSAVCAGHCEQVTHLLQHYKLVQRISLAFSFP